MTVAIKIGDRVVLSYLRIVVPGTILAISEPFAWVQWDKVVRPESVHLSDLALYQFKELHQ